jgi:hypothetical protein
MRDKRLLLCDRTVAHHRRVTRRSHGIVHVVFTCPGEFNTVQGELSRENDFVLARETSLYHGPGTNIEMPVKTRGGE